MNREQKLEEALRWYQSEALGAARSMQDGKPAPDAALAVLTVLALDGGKRADAALATPKAEPETLPCDVQLPGVLLRKGVSMDTLMFALKRREGRPEEDTRFRISPVPALTDEAVERAIDAIEGELNGVAATKGQARAILEHALQNT